MALEIIPGIATMGMSSANAMAPSFLNNLWSGIQGVGKSALGGIQDLGQGIQNSGLTDLANTGVNFWQAGQQNKMNKDLLGQRKTELGMQQEAFNRDKAYQDALKSIDWSSQQ